MTRGRHYGRGTTHDRNVLPEDPGQGTELTRRKPLHLRRPKFKPHRYENPSPKYIEMTWLRYTRDVREEAQQVWSRSASDERSDVADASREAMSTTTTRTPGIEGGVAPTGGASSLVPDQPPLFVSEANDQPRHHVSND